LPIAGDDRLAKAAVTEFLNTIGYDAVGAGALGPGGRRFEFGIRAFVAPYDRGTPAASWPYALLSGCLLAGPPSVYSGPHSAAPATPWAVSNPMA
jgi:hypothetical protein